MKAAILYAEKERTLSFREGRTHLCSFLNFGRDGLLLFLFLFIFVFSSYMPCKVLLFSQSFEKRKGLKFWGVFVYTTDMTKGRKGKGFN